MSCSAPLTSTSPARTTASRRSIAPHAGMAPTACSAVRRALHTIGDDNGWERCGWSGVTAHSFRSDGSVASLGVAKRRVEWSRCCVANQTLADGVKWVSKGVVLHVVRAVVLRRWCRRTKGRGTQGTPVGGHRCSKGGLPRLPRAVGGHRESRESERSG
ncbi:hypothetical protein FGB62_60g14 [Gracilaria domingensis]|nr:hypothetical protein FGB62_60g14 [Gracilaria domingensis]